MRCVAKFISFCFSGSTEWGRTKKRRTNADMVCIIFVFNFYKTWSHINFNDMNKKYIITNKCLMICFCSHPAAIDLADRCTSASFYPGSPEWGRKKGCPIENQYQHQETFNPINTKKHSETWPVALRSSRPGVRSTQDQHRQWPNYDK